jgi:hypothetical protein
MQYRLTCGQALPAAVIVRSSTADALTLDRNTGQQQHELEERKKSDGAKIDIEKDVHERPLPPSGKDAVAMHNLQENLFVYTHNRSEWLTKGQTNRGNPFPRLMLAVTIIPAPAPARRPEKARIRCENIGLPGQADATRTTCSGWAARQNIFPLHRLSMDFCVLAVAYPPGILGGAGSVDMSGTSERGKVWYGAMAFWVVVVALLAARVMLLDTETLKFYMAGAVNERSVPAGSPPSPPTLADAASTRSAVR